MSRSWFWFVRSLIVAILAVAVVKTLRNTSSGIGHWVFLMLTVVAISSLIDLVGPAIRDAGGEAQTTSGLTLAPADATRRCFSAEEGLLPGKAVAGAAERCRWAAGNTLFLHSPSKGGGMNKRAGLVGLTVVSSVVLSAAWATPKVAWFPNKALAGQLAPAVVTGAYQIQPPKGYAQQTQSGPGGSTAQAWVGAPRTDGTRPYLMLTTLTPPAGEETKYTLNQVSAKMLAGVERRRKDWKQAASETGTVNGLVFVRTYWRGADTVTGMMMHGFSYVAQDGKGFLQLSSQDVEPYTKTSLPLTEASALTFRKH